MPRDAQMVALGEALIDLVHTHSARPAAAVRALAGGSPLNVAVAAARLGVAAALITRLSNDALGRHLHAHLHAHGVDIRLLERGPEPTSLALADIDARGVANYRFYRTGAADTRLKLAGFTLPQSVRVGHVSLSLLRDATRVSAWALVRESGRAGNQRAGDGRVVWMADPNARPALWPSRETFAAECARWLPLMDVLKVSEEDLANLGWNEQEAAARAFAAGVAAVVVTAGADGARVHRPGRATLYAPGVAVTVVDTVGAGDTFSAALAKAFLTLGAPTLMDDSAWQRALQFANAAAALTCGRSGAQPPETQDVARQFPGALI